MNRMELVEKIARDNGLTKAAAGRLLESVLQTIVSVVKSGDSVSLVGFGTFKTTKRASRKGYNPQSKTAIKISASTVPKFVPGGKFKAAVDPKRAKRKSA